MLPLVNVACANLTREQVEVAEASFSTSLIEHVSDLGLGQGSGTVGADRRDGIVDEFGNVTDASILQSLGMAVPVGGEDRAVPSSGSFVSNVAELEQLGGVSSRDSAVMARRDVLLDDVLFSRSANDTVEVGRSHAFAASELVLGSQGALTRRAPLLLLLCMVMTWLGDCLVGLRVLVG